MSSSPLPGLCGRGPGGSSCTRSWRSERPGVAGILCYPIELYEQPRQQLGPRPEHDLSDPPRQEHYLSQLRAHESNVQWIASPCTTFCDWCLQNGGTRTFQNPAGKPTAKEQVGNTLSEYGAKVSRLLFYRAAFPSQRARAHRGDIPNSGIYHINGAGCFNGQICVLLALVPRTCRTTSIGAELDLPSRTIHPCDRPYFVFARESPKAINTLRSKATALGSTCLAARRRECTLTPLREQWWRRWCIPWWGGSKPQPLLSKTGGRHPYGWNGREFVYEEEPVEQEGDQVEENDIGQLNNEELQQVAGMAVDEEWCGSPR